MAKDNKKLYRVVLEQLPIGIIIADEKDGIIFVNKMAVEIRHVKASNITGCSILSCHPEKSHDKVNRALQYLKGKKPRDFKRMVLDHKKNRYYENVYCALVDSSENYIGSVIMSSDVTDRRKCEEERAFFLQNLQEKVTELTGKVQDLFISSMISLVHALEAKDPYTKEHSLRVSDIAVKLAEERWGVCPETKELELSGKLHDIGKVGIRESILNKSEGLSSEEYEHIKEHPLIAEKILMPIEKGKPLSKIIRHHHERWDGKGYPDGLKGEEIPVSSRILAIADSYDAMTSARPYRPPMQCEEAAGVITKNLGTQHDPMWGEIFLELFSSGSIG